MPQRTSSDKVYEFVEYVFKFSIFVHFVHFRFCEVPYFLSPMEFRSASSERGADESTGQKTLGVPGSLSGRSSGSDGCCARVASSGDWRAEGEFRSVKAGCTKQCRGGGPEGLF